MRGCPPGTVCAIYPSEWFQNNHFTEWFANFIQVLKSSDMSQVLLILDYWYPHLYNVDAVDTARSNHVTSMSISEHSSYKLPPLDNTFMSPFKAYSFSLKLTLQKHEEDHILKLKPSHLISQTTLFFIVK